jgi:purine/pyrimidine-nucleoside phosphorylase
MLTVNEYFDGKVKSIGADNSNGKQTVGVMLAGDYEFGTSEYEYMNLVSGSWEVKLPGSSEFVKYEQGSSFEVEANQKFQLKVAEKSVYLCRYE